MKIFPLRTIEGKYLSFKTLQFFKKYATIDETYKRRSRFMEKTDKWDKRFMELTETVAGWSSCFQETRHVGAIIVRDKRVMTTGSIASRYFQLFLRING